MYLVASAEVPLPQMDRHRATNCCLHCQVGGPFLRAFPLRLAPRHDDLLLVGGGSRADPVLVAVATACAGSTGTLRFRPRYLPLCASRHHPHLTHDLRNCSLAAVVWLQASTRAMCWRLVSLSHRQWPSLHRLRCQYRLDHGRRRSSLVMRRSEALRQVLFGEEWELLAALSF